MRNVEQHLDGLIVVDEHSEDYELLVSECDLDETRISLCSTGEEALRASGAFSSALWIVNVRLPDMSGIGFLKLVRRRVRRSSVFLVGDAYSAVDELAARSAGATAYFCKPPSVAWLEGYCVASRPPVFGLPTGHIGNLPAAMRPP